VRGRIRGMSTELPSAMGRPALRALDGAGYTSVEQVAGAAVAEIAALHGVGPKAIRVLRERLAELGLAFAGEKQAQAEASGPMRAPR
jgi:hypothetical protein